MPGKAMGRGKDRGDSGGQPSGGADPLGKERGGKDRDGWEPGEQQRGEQERGDQSGRGTEFDAPDMGGEGHGSSAWSPGHLKKQAGAGSARDFAPRHGGTPPGKARDRRGAEPVDAPVDDLIRR